MESELKFCRQCGKERSDGEDACAGCGWSFVEKVTSTVKPLTSSALRMMAQQPRRIKVGTKYEALQVLLNLVVFLSAVVTVFAVGFACLAVSCLRFSLPGLVFCVFFPCYVLSDLVLSCVILRCPAQSCSVLSVLFVVCVSVNLVLQGDFLNMLNESPQR